MPDMRSRKASGRRASASTYEPVRRVAFVPEQRENQLIALAFDLVEDRLRNKTASAQETTHFLKLATEKERLERERLENENLCTPKHFLYSLPSMNGRETIQAVRHKGYL